MDREEAQRRSKAAYHARIVAQKHAHKGSIIEKLGGRCSCAGCAIHAGPCCVSFAPALSFHNNDGEGGAERRRAGVSSTHTNNTRSVYRVMKYYAGIDGLDLGELITRYSLVCENCHRAHQHQARQERRRGHQA